MKKKLKKLWLLFLVFVLFANCSVMVWAGEHDAITKKDEYEYVTFAEAQNVAKIHIMDMCEKDLNIKWKQGVKIFQRKALFDLEGNLTAYYFELVNEKEESQGYIIVSADRRTYPIIEFSDEGVSFIDEAYFEVEDKLEWKENKTLEESSKILYLGGMTYAVEFQPKGGEIMLWDITTADCREVNKRDLLTNQETQQKDYFIIWEYYKQKSNTVGSSNPPDSKGDDFITAPGNYESGYKDYRSRVVTSGEHFYFQMSEFSTGGVCAPTAATNMCYYWYCRNTKYNALKMPTWQDTFNYLYTEMETNPTEGTEKANIPDALMLYFYERGLSCRSHLIRGTDYGKSVVAEINEDRPCLLMLSDHYMYGNHAVLAIGYKQYVYSGFWSDSYSTYIHIADGWQSYPTRYVWGSCKGSWDMVVVWPD